MAAQHLTPEARTGRWPLLVGPDGDVVLVDRAGVGSAEVQQRVAELSATGVSVAVGATTTSVAVAASAAGALVVVAAEGGRPALDRADALVSAGVPVGDLVVEVPFGPGPAPEAAVHAVLDAGFTAGIAVDGDDRAEPAAAAGWEIGALTATLALDVRTVRGVSPERFRRVVAVVAAIEAAAAGGRPSPAGADQRPGGRQA